ncbi:hypothetical protein GCM10027280_29640 [Micromonospora polyrhachis]|uniref:DUF4192 domain-containing protein n=1 Tax=Micromonospora polyrhachis TaxID=1282883 RepID=A0A7W7SQG2_9ACTN|nr:DUF4192 domain-containing protein [Micromonospora polyrhachis]MBB4959054.1 hypothetical protein [Micromonospora polyrhachis]
MDPADLPLLSVRSPADLLAAVPYLLGFHPADSLVVVALREKRVVFVARADLPDGSVRPFPPDLSLPPDLAMSGGQSGGDTLSGIAAAAREVAKYITEVVTRQDADAAVVVGYGPAERVTPAVDAVRPALEIAGLLVLDVLRVTDRRYWSYFCVTPECCPPEGNRYDPTASPIAAAATFAGKVALPDRATLVRQVAPVDGPVRESMHQATRRAQSRAATLINAAPSADLLGERALGRAGESAIRTAMERQRTGGRLTDDEAAWLSVLLTHLPVRDHAWERTDDVDWHQTLWLDLTRRAEPGLVAAPASLLAFAAWRSGDGALAAVAVERALRDQPDYSLALLLGEILHNGVQPSTLDGWPGGPAGDPGTEHGPYRRRPGRHRSPRDARNRDSRHRAARNRASQRRSRPSVS